MSMEMQLLVGISAGFALCLAQIGILLNWDRIRSFFKKHLD